MTRAARTPSAIVIGAGMTGILLAIRLRERGIRDLTVLEKAAEVGGTWRENTYPGIACDVPSHAYTYSFAPNPDWSHHFPPGAEILRYFRGVFDAHGLAECTRFGEEVTACAWDEERARWRVQTARGTRLEADLLFSATGILHHPVVPDIPGLGCFAGPAFHSARWDHSVELAGKRIGVVGTGSSATQIVVALAGMPGTTVSVFQRTPQWIVSMPDRAFSAAEKARFRRQPWRMRLIRRLSALVYAQGTAALTGNSALNRLVRRLNAWNARRYLERSVPDPLLRRQLTPDYAVGCKRVVINDRFYAAIQQPNVGLVTAPIARIEPQGIVTVAADGRESLQPLDVLVLATGFDPLAYVRRMDFRGRGGVPIAEAWREKISAYCSLCIPGFPNFFLMLGPNSPIGNQSVIEISETQVDWALQLVDAWRDGKLTRIEARPEALARWRETIRHRMRDTVWVSGCRSWYLDADGDAISWPDTWSNWRKTMAQPAWEDFVGPEG